MHFIVYHLIIIPNPRDKIHVPIFYLGIYGLLFIAQEEKKFMAQMEAIHTLSTYTQMTDYHAWIALAYGL